MKFKGLSASFIKNLAFILMLINHLCAVWNTSVSNTSWFLHEGHWYFTRISFPIFAFLIAEGMSKTKCRWKYMLRVLFIALISEPIYDWCFNNQWYYPEDQNVFFDLLFGMIAIVAYDRFKDKAYIIVPIIVLLLAATVFLYFNYCIMAVLVILFSYMFLQDKEKLCISLIVILYSCSYIIYFVIAWRNGWDISLYAPYLINSAQTEAHSVLAVPLIYFYNGERGKSLPKWFYYIFYPVHLLIIGIIFNCF